MVVFRSITISNVFCLATETNSQNHFGTKLKSLKLFNEWNMLKNKNMLLSKFIKPSKAFLPQPRWIFNRFGDLVTLIFQGCV